MSYPAALYELLHRGTPGDLDFYARACEGATSVLELGCGYGRVLERLASPGRRLVGLDSHEGLLARAAARVGDGAEFVQADMRDFSVPGAFERVLIPYCGLYCLLDDDAVQECLQRAREHLAPGGRLVMDAYVGEAFEDLEPIEEGPQMVTEVVTLDDGDRMWRVFEKSIYDGERQRLDVTYVHVPEDGGEPVEGAIPQRFLTRAQVAAHVLVAGFGIERFCAGYEGEAPYDEEADMWTLIAVRED